LKGAKVNLKPIKTTIIGGLVFLIPLVIVLAIVGKAFQLMAMLAEPVSAFIPIESVGGIAVANLVAILSIVALCFVAGLLARSVFGKRLNQALDSRLQALIPRYSFIKSITDVLGGNMEGQALKPVVLELDEMLQIAFEVERNDDQLVTVFIPGAPDPWSGGVSHVPSDRVKPLGASFTDAIKIMTKVGKGGSVVTGQTRG